LSFLGWSSDWAYGVDDGGGVVGTGDKSINNEDAPPMAFIAIPSAKKK